MLVTGCRAQKYLTSAHENLSGTSESLFLLLPPWGTLLHFFLSSFPLYISPTNWIQGLWLNSHLGVLFLLPNSSQNRNNRVTFSKVTEFFSFSWSLKSLKHPQLSQHNEQWTSKWWRDLITISIQKDAICLSRISDGIPFVGWWWPATETFTTNKWTFLIR